MTLDLLGIGLGPFNLSLAALADEAGIRAAFAERRARFAWHPGLMLPGATMQTSFLKDMVTPVLPTSRWSFLNHLVSQGRFHDFLAGRFDAVSRAEFAGYMGWVAHGLASTRFGAEVETVRHDGRRFRASLADGRAFSARALSVGAGPVPRLPDFVREAPDCLHVGRLLDERPKIAGRRVVVVGGGQSGAEAMLWLLQADPAPDQIVWVTRRSTVWTLQDGAFIDHFFGPDYLQAWAGFDASARAAALAEQKFAADGVTPETADAIYRAMYERLRAGRHDAALRPGREATAIARENGRWRLRTRAVGGDEETVEADLALFATGYRRIVPACLAPLADRLETAPDGGLLLEPSYRVRWDGPGDAPIYAMNHGRASHGLVDAQLSLAAWRAAIILNDLAGRQVFPLIRGEPGMVEWPRGATPQEARAPHMAEA